MSKETALTTVQQHDAPVEWGSREEIGALADRLRALMPGKLSQAEALTLAQYSAAVDANPFRGEVYAYTDKAGKMILVEGYKILVRWARRQCQFYERYERITNDTDTIPEEAIAFRCRILRQDAVTDLARLTEAGVSNAYEILTTEAVGVVLKAETWSSKYNKPISPPKGWTWEDVARKRALKNAINRAYGAPSPKEIARETWTVEDTLTIPRDWKDTERMERAEAEATAQYNAKQRLSSPPEESARESMVTLGFEEPLEELSSETPLEPELAEKAGSPWHTRVDLVGKARQEIPYYNHPAHILNTLKKLEEDGEIDWDMDDEAVLVQLNLYAKARADEKAGES